MKKNKVKIIYKEDSKKYSTYTDDSYVNYKKNKHKKIHERKNNKNNIWDELIKE